MLDQKSGQADVDFVAQDGGCARIIAAHLLLIALLSDRG
jgi:hypothetical protein